MGAPRIGPKVQAEPRKAYPFKFSVTTDEILRHPAPSGARMLFVRLCGYYGVKESEAGIIQLWDKTLGMLARATGTKSEATVRRWLRELAAYSLIEVTSRPGKPPFINVYPLEREAGRKVIVIPNAILALPGVSPNAKLFYGLVNSFGGSTEKGCFAKRGTLAERMLCTEGTIGKYERELSDAGVLRAPVKCGRTPEGKYFKQTTLFLRPDPLFDFPSADPDLFSGAESGDNVVNPTPCRIAGEDQSVTRPPQTRSYREYLLENSEEHSPEDYYATGHSRIARDFSGKGASPRIPDRDSVTDPDALRAQRIIEAKRRALEAHPVKLVEDRVLAAEVARNVK